MSKREVEKIEYSLGNIVLCDICNEDYTNFIDIGGFIFCNKAVCPKCATEFLKKIKSYNEENFIEAYCKTNKSFSDFIREYRGENCKIKIISF